MKKILFSALIAGALIMTSCKKDNDDFNKVSDSVECKNFIAGESQPSVYLGEGDYKVVNIETDQITYTEDRSVYMVSDMDYTKSYTLQIEGDLKLDSTVSVDYNTVGFSALKEEASTKMTVVNVDAADQTFWLWDAKAKIGFILLFEPIE